MATKKTAGKPGWVFAKANMSTGWNGGVVQLKKDEVWEASDPFVKANPDMFSDVPEYARNTADPRHRARPIERATAKPGEKRPV